MVIEILISGLCAFVKDTCAAGKTKAVSVVMLKGNADHHPRLVVDARDVKPPGDKDSPDVMNARHLADVIDLPDGRQFFVWDLTGCRLEIVDAPSIEIWEGRRDPASVRPDTRAHALKDPPDDFSWAPDLHAACSTSPAAAPPDPDASNDSVLPAYAVARLTKLNVAPNSPTTSNWLEGQFLMDVGSEPVFTLGASDKQVLADRARLTMQIPTSEIRLRLVPYDANGAAREIVLRQLAAGIDRVSVSLSNLPSVQEPKTMSIEHFSAYWDLLPANARKNCIVPKEEESQAGSLHHVYPVKCTICRVCGP